MPTAAATVVDTLRDQADLLEERFEEAVQALEWASDAADSIIKTVMSPECVDILNTTVRSVIADQANAVTKTQLAIDGCVYSDLGEALARVREFEGLVERLLRPDEDRERLADL